MMTKRWKKFNRATNVKNLAGNGYLFREIPGYHTDHALITEVENNTLNSMHN